VKRYTGHIYLFRAQRRDNFSFPKQRQLKIKTLQKYPGITCGGDVCLVLIKIFRRLELKGMPASFNSLVERGNKIFLGYSYHLILVHTIKNISPNQLDYLLV